MVFALQEVSFPGDYFSRRLLFQEITFPGDYFSRRLLFQEIIPHKVIVAMQYTSSLLRYEADGSTQTLSGRLRWTNAKKDWIREGLSSADSCA
jgi:hypothetical protein